MSVIIGFNLVSLVLIKKYFFKMTYLSLYLFFAKVYRYLNKLFLKFKILIEVGRLINEK